MKSAAAVVAVVAGALLLVIPRFVFPACEYLGRGRMHCTDAAHGEFVIGGLLLLSGVSLFLLRPGGGAVAAAAIASALCAAAFFVPAYTRYCASPEMPCHYGMVPSIRFIAVVAGLVELAALAGLARAAAGRRA